MSIRNGHARWAFDLAAWRPSHADLMFATACIQPEEKERLAKFVFRNDFDASLIGRLLMRKFIHNSADMPYSQIRIERDARGRPNVPLLADRLDVNISHQGGFSVLAGYCGKVASQLRIGVDAMKMEYTGGKPIAEFFRIMERNFTDNEWSYIKNAGTEAAQIHAFMRTWCLKESYTKTTGIGITADLRSIDFTCRSPVDRVDAVPVTDTIVCVAGESIRSDWRFEESLLDEDHCVCVALQREGGQQDDAAIPFEMIEFDELMTNAERLLEEDSDYCTDVMDKEYKKHE